MGEEYIGDYTRITVTPPGGQEQDFLNITARELYGSDPQISDKGVPFYFLPFSVNSQKEKEGFPLREERGEYIIKLHAISSHITVGIQHVTIVPSIMIWADGRLVVDTSYPASIINKKQDINEEWTFTH
ncbi:hypothetical protein ACT7DF_23080 [Bacillus cereus]